MSWRESTAMITPYMKFNQNLRGRVLFQDFFGRSVVERPSCNCSETCPVGYFIKVTWHVRLLDSSDQEGSWTVRGSGSPALDGFWSALHESRLARRRTGFGRIVCRAMLYFPVLGHRIHSRSTYAVFNPPLLDEPCRVSTYSCCIGGELYESVGVEAPILLSYTHKN